MCPECALNTEAEAEAKGEEEEEEGKDGKDGWSEELLGIQMRVNASVTALKETQGESPQ
jgi:hypothetical protein